MQEPATSRVASSTLLQAVGLRARALRLQRQLTLDELSSRSGVSRRTITLLEAGDANASLATLDKLARALGIDFGSLVVARPAAPFVPEVAQQVSPVWEDGLGSSARLLVSHPQVGRVIGEAHDRGGGPEPLAWPRRLSPATDRTSLRLRQPGRRQGPFRSGHRDHLRAHAARRGARSSEGPTAAGPGSEGPRAAGPGGEGAQERRAQAVKGLSGEGAGEVGNKFDDALRLLPVDRMAAVHHDEAVFGQ
jgi:transcriptional regulator with XRE-family HTH domain